MPGPVQIYKLPLDKINEIQAHSRPIERMRLSYDNNYLFTAGQDAALIIHAVSEKEDKDKDKREPMALAFSDEILTKKDELDA